MLQISEPRIAETDTGLLTLEQAGSTAIANSALQTLLEWLADYPVHPHRDLGRAGVVCPFTRPAQKLDTIRVAVSTCGETEEKRAFGEIGGCLRALETIPAEPGDEHFRTIVTVFPNCAGDAGTAMLEQT